MDGNVKDLETQEYLRLCQKQWHWILDNYDSLIKEGYKDVWKLKGAYFEEYDLDEPESRCYLCELTNSDCLKCPLSGIAWRKDYNYPCVRDKSSVYRRIEYLFDVSKDEETKDAIKKFLSIIDKECQKDDTEEV